MPRSLWGYPCAGRPPCLRWSSTVVTCGNRGFPASEVPVPERLVAPRVPPPSTLTASEPPLPDPAVLVVEQEEPKREAPQRDLPADVSGPDPGVSTWSPEPVEEEDLIISTSPQLGKRLASSSKEAVRTFEDEQREFGVIGRQGGAEARQAPPKPQECFWTDSRVPVSSVAAAES